MPTIRRQLHLTSNAKIHGAVLPRWRLSHSHYYQLPFCWRNHQNKVRLVFIIVWSISNEQRLYWWGVGRTATAPIDIFFRTRVYSLLFVWSCSVIAWNSLWISLWFLLAIYRTSGHPSLCNTSTDLIGNAVGWNWLYIWDPRGWLFGFAWSCEYPAIVFSLVMISLYC